MKKLIFDALEKRRKREKNAENRRIRETANAVLNAENENPML